MLFEEGTAFLNTDLVQKFKANTSQTIKFINRLQANFQERSWEFCVLHYEVCLMPSCSALFKCIIHMN